MESNLLRRNSASSVKFEGVTNETDQCGGRRAAQTRFAKLKYRSLNRGLMLFEFCDIRNLRRLAALSDRTSRAEPVGRVYFYKAIESSGRCLSLYGWVGR